jgi:hypothetical protein
MRVGESTKVDSPDHTSDDALRSARFTFLNWSLIRLRRWFL